MRQYAEQKHRVGDAVLLFRMGDFYETFWDDAVLCSKVLGIALTSRDRNSSNPTPLAGIPYHALESYLGKLVAAGYKVAISEQMEDPKLAKGVVQRDVVRIVTAGTLTDEALLPDREDNTLAAVCIREHQAGAAIAELAGGRLEVIDAHGEQLLDELVRLRPAELIIDDERRPASEDLARKLHEICGTTVTRRGSHEFAAYQAERSLLTHFGVATLSGFGFDHLTPGLCAAGGILEYLRETQKTSLGHITTVRRRAACDAVAIDHGSWRSLEIDRTLRSGSVEGTLLHAIDRTMHPHGTRMLRHWLRAPLRDAETVRRRQCAVAALVDEDRLRRQTRQRLRHLADVERITARVALARCFPRDLHALGRTLSALPAILEDLRGHPSELLRQVMDNVQGLDELAALLSRAIREEPANALREGGFIADGYDAGLDRLRAIGKDGQQWLAEYQRREIERSGIGNLKAGFNRVFGYYLEIPNASRAKAPPEYVRRQTVKNAERYITEELKRYEDEVLTAQDRAQEREFTLFEQLREQVARWTTPLLRAAEAIAQLDCIAGLAELAVDRRYVQPEIVDDGRLEIRDGRHPVLDRTLGDAFVPNDVLMTGSDARVFVITGPNMAGKSTYVRQVALLTVLAQIGSFVPAKSMKLSLVDRIFARVGSADEIMRGQSTFMVEMTEAANVLHYATRDSLVILDELGRGTSTFDGLSLAWAITEHLATKIACRTLVATHYHELIELGSLLFNVRNFNVAVREYPAAKDRDEAVVFLHKIVEGGASRSYGIHVARLAGIPKTVIDRSREVLEELQRGFERESRSPSLSGRRTRDDAQMLLFADPGGGLLAELRDVDPQSMTPLEAIKQLAEWKERYH
ncbi:MAG: DNA mismatch repair protein MutS [Planctomycetota bacterium]